MSTGVAPKPGIPDERFSELKKQLDDLAAELKKVETGLSQLAESHCSTDITDLKTQSRNVNLVLGSVVIFFAAFSVWLLFTSWIHRFELRTCLLCLSASVLGSSTSAFISALQRRANGYEIHGIKIPPGDGERLNEKMVDFFYGRPLLGCVTGLLVYVATLANVLLKQEGTPDQNKMIFYSLLAGLFAKTLIEKLKAIFNYVFEG